MQIGKAPPKMAKKLWNLVRIMFYMTREGISKSKLDKLDLDFLMKRGKTAIKAVGNLMLHHHQYSTLSCRSDDVLSSFVSPREYEFSCSNSPAYPYHHWGRRNQHHHHPKYDRRFHRQAEELDVLQQVFDILNPRDHTDQYPLNSQLVRQLRVTDSPFPLNDHTEENHQVDRCS